jgi:hypothetical protein
MKRIVQQRLTALLEKESTGIRRLEPLLLFAGEHDPNTVSGVSRISSKLNQPFSRLHPARAIGQDSASCRSPRPI